MIRYDKKNGEFVDIKPIEQAPGEAYKWNWDAPLLISKFNNKRLYFAANKVFRTDDQGSTWKTISGDLSRNLDRNKLMVMDKVWSVDAIAKMDPPIFMETLRVFQKVHLMKIFCMQEQMMDSYIQPLMEAQTGQKLIIFQECPNARMYIKLSALNMKKIRLM